MKYLFFLFGLFGFVELDASTFEEAQKEVTEMVHYLHQINGNYLRGEAPQVVMNEAMNNGASYNPIKHTLTIDLEIYRICQTFDQQSSDALAFIIGHEMAHCYMEHDHFSGFNSYHKTEGASINEEQQADLYGLFIAYLAGYNSLTIVPQILERIYTSYNLEDNLDGYPSKKERMSSAKTVQLQVKELIDIYEAANYLSAIGKYELATASYQHLLTFYQGREIYNNLAVNHILEALHFTEKDIDWYLFPMEIDWDTRIKKPKKDRGDGDLTAKEKAYRMQHLIAAKSNFEIASKLDANYISSNINIICALTLMGEYKEAINHYNTWFNKIEKDALTIKQTQKESAQLALAIAKAHLPAYTLEANKIFQELAASSHEHIAFQASYNLKILKEGICGAAQAYYCFEPINKPNYVDDVRLHRKLNLNSSIKLSTNYALSIKHFSNSSVFQYHKEGSSIFKLQLITKNNQPIKKQLATGEKYKMVTTNKGYFILCESKRSIFYLSPTNKLHSWAHYY